MKRLLCCGGVLACILCVPSAFAWPGCEEDWFDTEVAGSAVTIFHNDAAYNCCPDDFEYTVEVQGTEILVLEREILTDPCACLCCYDLSVVIEDLAPGEYTLLFTWHDSESGEWEMWSDTIVIPDVGQGGAAHVTGWTNSGCLDPNPVDDPEVESSPWGQVKAKYR